MTVVELDFRSFQPDQAPAAVHRALMEALDRSIPFAAVLLMPPTTTHGHGVRGAAERIRMLKQLRPGLADRCAGIAFVLPAEAQRAMAKQLRAGPKLWGCPTTAIADVEAARAWAHDQLMQT